MTPLVFAPVKVLQQQNEPSFASLCLVQP